MKLTRTRVAGLLALVAIGGGATVAATPATANNGYDICVPAGTPVETGPGESATYTLNGGQAWHVYVVHDNQWTEGYVSRTSPVVRGWLWAGHNDGRAPREYPDGSADCP